MKAIEAREDFDPIKEIPSLENKVLFITGGISNTISCTIIELTVDIKGRLGSEPKLLEHSHPMDHRIFTSLVVTGRLQKSSSLRFTTSPLPWG